jgi:hydrogenase maturation protein HypF
VTVAEESATSRRRNARWIKVRGVVQGVGFRPFVFRLARANTLAGWVFNGEEGVEIFLEGADDGLEAFVHELKTAPPPAAQIAEIEVIASEPCGIREFTIRESRGEERPTTRISPDLPICDDCLRELFDPADKRHRYPYINCTNCGPRYTVTLALPYDRKNTTMSRWPLDEFCARQYHDPGDRRFHAQPVACSSCGPAYFLQCSNHVVRGTGASIREAARLLAAGKIVAVKGLGGYHLACDARNAAAIRELRERKYRKEKPFALMARNLDTAREIIALTPEGKALLTATARPIVIARARAGFPGVAPESSELGVMLPYTPLHHLLFDAGAPAILVMTSANRSSEPIAYEDSDALERLSAIADAFLIGERPIARRVDDSVVRASAFGPTILRRARGYAPGAVTTIPTDRPILAVGADLKNTITLVVEGQAFVSQHIGDLQDYASLRAFQETIDDLTSMYQVDWDELLVMRDAHPQQASTEHAQSLPACARGSVQHHRAHVASVLAEHRAWDNRVVGVSFDGTGYGDDGTIWGGEIFLGSIRGGLDRVAHLRRAVLPGGDAAAQYPVQASAGFLVQLEHLPELNAPPFSFPERYDDARMLLRKGVRSFTTTSMGRLFDAAAALLGFTRGVSFEGQAAMWLEQLARTGASTDAYEFPFDGSELDFRPLLGAVVQDRADGRQPREIARAFQRGIARGVAQAITTICATNEIDTAVLSGGVFQNELLLEDLREILSAAPLAIWTNHEVPANDGGISLGQAALAAFGRFAPDTAGLGHA